MEKMVFEEVNAYNEEFHSENSTLLKMNFEAALDQFEDHRSTCFTSMEAMNTKQKVKVISKNWVLKVKKEEEFSFTTPWSKDNFGVKNCGTKSKKDIPNPMMWDLA